MSAPSEAPEGSPSAVSTSPAEGATSETGTSAPDTDPIPRSTDVGLDSSGEASVRSTIEKAFDRGRKNAESSGSEAGQATGDASDSTRSQTDTAGGTSDGSLVEDNGGANGPDTSASTPVSQEEKTGETKPVLPDNWPDERKGDFAKLPEQGQRLLLDIYKDMDTGLQQKFQQLATERKRLQDNFGLEPQQIHDLAAKARQYQEDPVALITTLADQSGIKIFFDKQGQAVPEFESVEDQTKWIMEQTLQKSRQETSDQLRKTRAEQEKTSLQEQRRQDLLQASEKYSDFTNHREAIIQILSTSNVSAEQAYQLATWNNLMKMAKSGSDLSKDLEKTRTELETLKKQSTMPPSGPGDRTGKDHLNGMDVYEQALSRGKRNLNSQS